jgi:hypothetical protein
MLCPGVNDLVALITCFIIHLVFSGAWSANVCDGAAGVCVDVWLVRGFLILLVGVDSAGSVGAAARRTSSVVDGDVLSPLASPIICASASLLFAGCVVGFLAVGVHTASV